MLLSGSRAYLNRATNWRKFAYYISGGETPFRSRGLLSSVASPTDNGADDIKAQISAAGEKVRDLKAAKGPKGEIEAAVTKLLDLKSTFEKITGTPYDQKKPNKKKKEDVKNGATKGAAAKDEAKSKESDRITPRGEDYSAWYNDIVYSADLIDLSPVRGCAVIKPWGYSIWDNIKREVDDRITNDMETSNAYFPLFIPKSFLSKEADHIDGFAKECAVVTHHRLRADDGELIPDPEAKLEEPLIVRPTSETIIWNMFAKWINSYRDLPLKINQWANVVRWEMRTRPFLRTAEFLWQEGHTAHATSECARECATKALDMYASVCEEFLAMPVVKGVKSPSERFAGADDTLTIEALMQNGWALQSGTSHMLGQNFAKAFDVYFQNENGERDLVWATSWGVSTRLIGALIMTHSDDKGLVVPPRIAPLQVVIVPIKQENEDVSKKVDELYFALKKAGIKVKVDDRNNMRPGAKYFEWERKGVPLRIDIGPRDVESNVATVVSRHDGVKRSISAGDDFVKTIENAMATMHEDLLNAASERLASKTLKPQSYGEMKDMLEKAGNGDLDSAGFYLVPWKCNEENEEFIKGDCKATIRCYPFEHNKGPPADGMTCFYSGEQATHMAIFARNF